MWDTLIWICIRQMNAFRYYRNTDRCGVLVSDLSFSYPRMEGCEICLECYLKGSEETMRTTAISWWTGTTSLQSQPEHKKWMPITTPGWSSGQWCWVDNRQGVVVNGSLGAGNYHQPQLPSANMADSDVGTERYSLFMQILSTHFGVWGLYTTEYHVCTYWTPPFDLRIATFAARRWGKKRRADGNLQFSKQRMMVIAPLLWW